MMEFIQDGYNVYEHNQTEWSDEKLLQEVETLKELLKIPHRGEKRLSQLALRKTMAETELNLRTTP